MSLTALREIAHEIAKTGVADKREVARIKKRIARKYSLSIIPSDADILRAVKDEPIYRELREILRLKPVRTISGVAVVSVMTSPAKCPHGKCIPCPGGVEFNTPQSYIGFEPAAQRGRQHGYDSFRQVTARLRELKEIGHDVDKVEIIVMGGTFPARDESYKMQFILGIYSALNSFESEAKLYSDLEAAKRDNERARTRCVGMTFETRPDYAREEDIVEMLRFGGTKVELGVQSIYDDVLERIQRGHDVREVVLATKRLRDSAFKVGYHIMPGLPGSDFKKDLKMFRTLFENPNFRPDYLKIYPTLVVKGTELYRMYENGDYRPYTTEEVVELIARAKRYIPEYVRIQRIQRDIPVNRAIGLDRGNVRQMVHERLRELGYSCRCIRCREAGHRLGSYREKDFEEVVREYCAGDGREFFISFEDPSSEVLVGFTRLRFPDKPFIQELADTALIRELHVYGKAVEIGKRERDAFQHRGFGEKLLGIAESIAKEKYDRIAVISGVGVRSYYRKRGYARNFEYMMKRI